MSTKTAIQDSPETLWTAREVAAYLRASESWVRKASAAGRLPCLRIGSMVRFDPETIRLWATRGPAQLSPRR